MKRIIISKLEEGFLYELEGDSREVKTIGGIVNCLADVYMNMRTDETDIEKICYEAKNLSEWEKTGLEQIVYAYNTLIESELEIRKYRTKQSSVKN